MIPFHIDPRWFQECWYDDAADGTNAADEAETLPRTGRLARIAIVLALVAALPTLSYLGFRAAAGIASPFATSTRGG